MTCFTFSVVGGDEMVNITGVFGEKVLLPCSCPNATVNEELRWQNDKSKEKVYDNKSNNISDRYRNRSEIFLPWNPNNCSILLTNITADDQGTYRCGYEINGLYKKDFVNLSVSGKSVSQSLFIPLYIKMDNSEAIMFAPL